MRLLAAILLLMAAAAPASADALSFAAGPKHAPRLETRTPGDGVSFSDCADGEPCPRMVVVPPSKPGFRIGSPADEEGRVASEAQHPVSLRAFAVGQHEVSVSEYLACVEAKSCRHPEWLEPGSEHHIETGSGITYKSLAASISGSEQPVVGISWDDAVAYTEWLSQKTGHRYRLLSEAEWEHAARAGTTTPFWWGSAPRRNGEVMACCVGCGSTEDRKGFLPVKSLTPNPWGLYHVHGNVWEWVADYFCDSYASGPSDGSARSEKACPKQESPEGLRVFRGGSCFYEPRQMRAAMRLRNWPSFRNQTVGFRIARDL